MDLDLTTLIVFSGLMSPLVGLILKLRKDLRKEKAERLGAAAKLQKSIQESNDGVALAQAQANELLIKNYNQRFKQMEARIKALNRKVETLEEKGLNQDNRVKFLTAENTEKDEALKHQFKRTTDLSDKVSDENAERVKLEAEVKDLKRQIDKLEKTVLNLAQAKNVIQAENVRLTSGNGRDSK